MTDIPSNSNSPRNLLDANVCKRLVENVIESRYMSFTMATFTLWALFGNDIRLAATGKNADEAFLIIISVIFFCFLIEIFCSVYYKQGYLHIPSFQREDGEELFPSLWRRCQIGSFYFWLDIVATLSLILEINWIIGNGLNSTTPQNAKSVQAGARAGRVLRLVRMVRLVRLVKLYKYFSTSKRSGDENESRVGSAMSDLTNRRVIILILSMLIIVPTLTVSLVDATQSSITEMIHRIAIQNSLDPANFQAPLQFAINRAIQSANAISIQFDGAAPYYLDAAKMDSLRNGVETIIYEGSSPGFRTIIVFDTKDASVSSALFSIYTTIFVMCLLQLAIYFFSSDVESLVIHPIECMVELVRKISKNPLEVKYEMLGAKDGFVEGMETTILLSTINKIGGLMRVGFGEAGASVIARNLSESTGGKLNLMGSGTMIQSIFGFCDVRQFTDTTECLQEEVMLFVNRIAHILHSIVVQCSGSANKNIGDAFLLTWKIDDNLKPDEISDLADQALVAFCKTLVELNRHEEFICKFSVAATSRLFKRFPGYHVRIGSGLHYGWAIEGAIGSNRKIDVSYLSPNVNFTEFLESSTKAYGVPLLMSEPFWELLSPVAKNYCRQVDRVRRSDHEDPVGLFTYDSDIKINFADANRKKPRVKRASITSDRRGSAIAAAALEMKTADKKPDEENAEQKSMQAPVFNIPKYSHAVWDTDADLVDLRHMVNASFRNVWAQGIAAYLEGGPRWALARETFVETLRLSGGVDGPSKFLLEFMEEYHEEHWPGYRNEGGGH